MGDCSTFGKSYTKEEILTMYLNKYDFLNLAVGISSAADIYFQVPLDSLESRTGGYVDRDG